ncbi:MAG: hypothetical protein ACLR5Z_07760 [Dialister invisus]
MAIQITITVKDKKKKSSAGGKTFHKETECQGETPDYRGVSGKGKDD